MKAVIGLVWKPTHRITFTPDKGEAAVYDVMHVDESGNGYTKAEWEDGGNSSWSVDEGAWLYDEQATPGGANGTVEVQRFPLPPTRIETVGDLIAALQAFPSDESVHIAGESGVITVRRASGLNPVVVLHPEREEQRPMKREWESR